MGKKLGCLLLAAALILGGVSMTGRAAPPSAEPPDSPAPEAAESQSPEGETPPEETQGPEASPDSEDSRAPEESGEPQESGDPEESEEPEEPEPPTLEELRDTLMAILGDSEETQPIRANVNRMIALGDPGDTLRQWLKATIRKYQLEQELTQLTGALDALEASSGELEALAQAAAELTAEPDELLLQMVEICPTAAALLEGLEVFDSAGEQGLQFAAILAGGDGTDAGRSLTAVRLLLAVKDSGLLDEAGIAAAQSELAVELGRLTALCQSVTGQRRETLEAASQALAGRANLAGPLSPARLAPVGRALRYTAPVFTYNGAIMLSLEDAAEFLGGEVLEQGDTLIITAPGTVLELVKGSSDGYLNDKLCKLAAPVLNFDRVYYLPLDTVLKCCGMERLTVEGFEVLCRPVARTAAAGQDAAG